MNIYILSNKYKTSKRLVYKSLWRCEPRPLALPQKSQKIPVAGWWTSRPVNNWRNLMQFSACVTWVVTRRAIMTVLSRSRGREGGGAGRWAGGVSRSEWCPPAVHKSSADGSGPSRSRRSHILPRVGWPRELCARGIELDVGTNAGICGFLDGTIEKLWFQRAPASLRSARYP